MRSLTDLPTGNTKLRRNLTAFAITALLGCSTAPVPLLAAQDTSHATGHEAVQFSGTHDSGLYVKVHLVQPLKMSKLKPGDAVEGTLARDVYSADQKLFDGGSGVRLTVDHLEKRRRIPNDHWPGVIKIFTPRHENYPVFKTATVTQSGRDHAMQVSMITVSRMRDVHALPKKIKGRKSSGDHGSGVVTSEPQKAPTPTMILEAWLADEATSAREDEQAARPDVTDLEDLPAGAHCKILLLGDVSASKSKPGDVVRARVLEPVILNSKVVVPAGSLIDGKVVKEVPPKWLSRAGSLYFTFTGLTLPGGNQIPITASLSAAELDERSHTKIDSEGQLHGERPGKLWMAINLGVSAGIAKEADDTFQLIIEAIVSTATDASTAGSARIIAGCASGIYMATRKGRDVVLPRFTEMEISFDRPVSVKVVTRPGTSGADAGK